MVLIGAVQQVVSGDVYLGYLLVFQQDVGTCRQVHQRIAGRGRLGVVGTVDVVLLQVALDAC